MIDKTKNHVYIIKVIYYTRENKNLVRHVDTYTSNHSIVSDKFRKWLDIKMEQIPNFAFLEEEWGEQYTVPLADFCN
jgi:hypothetical protein